MRQDFDRLLGIWREAANLSEAVAVLSWDQQCYMPKGGAAARGEAIALLTRLLHERFTSPEVGELIAKVEPWAREQGPGSFEAACVRVARREYDRAARVPADLEYELAMATSEGFSAWIEARRRNDFSVFRPKLERIVELTLKKADALREGRGGAEPLSRYDALLDLYEPDARTKDVADLFSAVREELVPLVRAVAERPDRVRGDLLVGDFDEDKQWDFGIEVLTAMGFDFDRGRQDRSEHPFTTGFTPDDVRLTTRFGRHLGIGLYGTMHEGGHGLYEQGIPGAWALTPIGTTASLGVHESQSRLWENVIGRSRHFWNHYLPRLKEYFPELAPVDLETFYRAVNESHPSLIRVDADELTYNLHIFLRFDLEQKLVAGDLAVGDLPEAWNEGMREYLGVTPPDHVQGVLQDVHWSGGMIGYFPTYALGNIMSLQLYEAALRERPSLPEEVARGELGGVLEWMRRNVHEKGATVTGVELLRQVTGTGFDPAPYLRYLKEKYTEIYGF